jgi:hypothetical protein
VQPRAHCLSASNEKSIGFDPSLFGSYSLRRTKGTLIYRRTGGKKSLGNALIRNEIYHSLQIACICRRAKISLSLKSSSVV